MAYNKIQAAVQLPELHRLNTTDEKVTHEEFDKFSSDLISSLEIYLNSVSQHINDLVNGYVAIVRLQKQTSAPPSPVSGMIAYADGTLWNPGAGEGIYGYYGGVWNKL